MSTEKKLITPRSPDFQMVPILDASRSAYATIRLVSDIVTTTETDYFALENHTPTDPAPYCSAYVISRLPKSQYQKI